MARNSELFNKVDNALRSDSISIQNGALSSLIQSVTRYVEQIKADEEIISQIHSYERKINSLRREKTEESEEELKEARELLAKARSLENEMRRKRQVINSLKTDVQTLYREVSRL